MLGRRSSVAAARSFGALALGSSRSLRVVAGAVASSLGAVAVARRSRRRCLQRCAGDPGAGAVRSNSRGGSVKAYGGVVVKLMARTVRVKFRGCAGDETFDVKTERVLMVAS